jgi:CDP-diacylglycerol--glycerol-3-phosphate 3-phosphatidyltransferase
MLIVAETFSDLSYIMAFLIAIAGFTDFADGYLARRANVVSELGALFDPIADKIVVSLGLIILVAHSYIPAYMAGFVLMREFFVSGLRMSSLKKDLEIPVGTVGKWKASFQYSGMMGLFLGGALASLGYLFLWVSIILGTASGIQYWNKYRLKTSLLKNQQVGVA